MQKRYILFLLLWGTCFFGYTQQVHKGFELYELLKIAEVYRQAPHLSFEVEYTYADSAQPARILERLKGASKIRSGLYWGMLDNVELVQGTQYSLGVFYQDSLITVSNRQADGNVLQLPFSDSLFRAANVDSMSITRQKDASHMLTILFNSNSVYSRYRLHYDAETYLVSRVEYYTKGLAVSEEEQHSGVSLISVRLFNYSFDPVSSDLFRESRFISVTAGAFAASPAFTNFKIIDNTAK